MSWYSAKKIILSAKGCVMILSYPQDKSRVISLYIKAHILTFPTGGAVWDCCCCWCYWSTKTCMPCKGKLHIQTTEETNWSILYKQYHGCTGYIIFKIEAISQIVPNLVNCTMVTWKVHFLNKKKKFLNAAKWLWKKIGKKIKKSGITYTLLAPWWCWVSSEMFWRKKFFFETQQNNLETFSQKSPLELSNTRLLCSKVRREKNK